MEPSKTTTLRISSDLRNEIAELARRRGMSMADVVSDAVRRLQLDDWWSSVHQSLDSNAPQEIADYRTESRMLDATASDGLL